MTDPESNPDTPYPSLPASPVTPSTVIDSIYFERMEEDMWVEKDGHGRPNWQEKGEIGGMRWWDMGQECHAPQWYQGHRLSILSHSLLILAATAYLARIGIFNRAYSEIDWRWDETHRKYLINLAFLTYAYAFGILYQEVVRLIISHRIRQGAGVSVEGILAQIGGISSLSIIRLLQTGQASYGLAWLIVSLIQLLMTSAGAFDIALDTNGSSDITILAFESVTWTIISIGISISLLAIVLEVAFGRYNLISGPWVLIGALDPVGRIGLCAANPVEANAWIAGRRFYLRDVAGKALVGHLELTQDPSLPCLDRTRRYAGLSRRRGPFQKRQLYV